MKVESETIWNHSDKYWRAARNKQMYKLKTEFMGKRSSLSGIKYALGNRVRINTLKGDWNRAKYYEMKINVFLNKYYERIER